MTVELHHGDCLEVLRGLPDASVDAVVTDPPYYLRFMGRDWDTAAGPREQQAAHEAWAREVLRVLKPGGFMLAFGGTRTYHRLACAVEDAGFVVKDSLNWLYGSGFPKSLDVSKALDAVALKGGSSYRQMADVEDEKGAPLSDEDDSGIAYGAAGSRQGKWRHGARRTPTEPLTDLARQWAVFGTALKPAHEPIVLAQKPLDGTYANNVVKWGCGALNVDGCRVEGQASPRRADETRRETSVMCHETARGAESRANIIVRQRTPYEGTAGRWPPNLLLSHAADCADACAPGCPVAGLDAQAHGVSRFFPQFAPDAPDAPFLYCPKASRAERNAGCEGLPKRSGGCLEGNADIANARKIGARPDLPVAPTANHHPTVKPVALMRWLVRLVCPPGGTVLDPFAGSGTTPVACIKEGASCIAIEREAEYLEIACARVAHAEAEVRGAAGRARQLGLEVAD